MTIPSLPCDLLSVLSAHSHLTRIFHVKKLLAGSPWSLPSGSCGLFLGPSPGGGPRGPVPWSDITHSALSPLSPAWQQSAFWAPGIQSRGLCRLICGHSLDEHLPLRAPCGHHHPQTALVRSCCSQLAGCGYQV